LQLVRTRGDRQRRRRHQLALHLMKKAMVRILLHGRLRHNESSERGLMLLMRRQLCLK
jgi:hypothetical protein